jgi:PAS domain-containing protein
MQKPTAIFEGNPLAMWIHDLESLHFLEVNESAQSQYEIYPRRIYRSNSQRPLRPTRGGPVQPILKMGMTDPDAVFVHRKRDGTRICVKTRGNNVLYDGQAGRFVIAEDVTERRHAHEQLF